MQVSHSVLTKNERLYPIFLREGRSRKRYKAGYISRSGDVVVEPKYEFAHPFREGLGSVRSGELLWGAVNAQGETVIRPISDRPLEFTEGLTPYWRKLRAGAMNAFGELLTPPRYDEMSHFSDGLACVRVGKLYGYIDSLGSQVIPPFFDDARAFCEGLAAVKLGGKWGYISPSGSLAIDAIFDCSTMAGPFRCGLARVASGGKWGYIERSGQFVIPPQFDSALEFSEGLAEVQIQKRRGYVDINGRLAVPTIYRWAGPFSEGLAAVDVGTGASHKTIAEACETGFIDQTGTFVITPRFLSTGKFLGGLCIVEMEKHIGYVQRDGSFLWRSGLVEGVTSDPHNILPPERPVQSS